MNNSRVSEVLISMSQMQRETFKNASNEGYVFVRRRPLDFGNYVYTVLYDASLRAAQVRQAPAL